MSTGFFTTKPNVIKHFKQQTLQHVLWLQFWLLLVYNLFYIIYPINIDSGHATSTLIIIHVPVNYISSQEIDYSW